MKRRWKIKGILFLAVFLMISFIIPAAAEEESQEENYEEETQEETEYIPEAYYDPIQSNDLKDWPQGQAVQAAAAVVMDLDTNAFLYSKNAYEKMYPASITKIMTALLALEKGNLEDEITFSEIVYDIEADSSHAGIKPGETMTLRDALEALMLESANDAANGLAEYFSGSISGFAEEMNAKAESLGCINTHFTNPHGLHNEDHYTCAYDMALIAQEAYGNQEFRELVSNTLYTCEETNLTEEIRYFVNHHKMIQQESEYYVSWCTGGKTGFTSDAWNTLVTYGEKEDMRLVCVLLRENGAGRAYLETTDLMNYGFEQFERVELEEEGGYPSFYRAMNLDYLGLAASLFQAESLKEPIAKTTKEGMVTLPKGMGQEALTGEAAVENRTADISYLYQDWPVGNQEITLTPLNLKVSLPFEQRLDIQALTAPTASRKALNEIEATALTVMENTQDVFRMVSDESSRFIEENTLLVICVGCFLLVVLVIFMIILICRCTKEARMMRRRRQEEKERQRMEEEIEQKTTEEIENELREAMEQERQRRKQEEARKEEEQIQEEKLHETERILEEINRKDSV